MPYLKEPDYSHGQQAKTGILLVNLGTPEAPTPQALRSYLKEFLSDPRVVEIPQRSTVTTNRGAHERDSRMRPGPPAP